MDNKTQGNLAEIAAMYYYRSLGYSVSMPIFEDCHVDLHIQKDGKVKRVQVKSSRCKANSGNYIAALTTSGGNTSWSGISKRIDKDFVDFIFILTELGEIYEYASKKLHARNTVTVRKELPEYIARFGFY
jgi:hypothetical protein